MKINYLLLAIILFSIESVYPQLISPKLIGPPGGPILDYVKEQRIHFRVQDNKHILFTKSAWQNVVIVDLNDKSVFPIENYYGGKYIHEFDVAFDDPAYIYMRTWGFLSITSDYGKTWKTVKHDENVGQYSFSIAINPLNSKHIFFCLYNNELWETFDRGETLHFVKKFSRDNYFSDIKIAPSDTSIVYLYSDSLHKSTDAGRTWNSVSDIPYNTGEIRINPKNPNSLFFMNEMGLFRSYDGGKNIFEIKDWLNYDLMINPADTSLIFCSGIMEDNYFRIMRSTDAGNSWSQITNFSTPYTGGFTCNPENPEEIYVLAWKGIFKTTDRGSTWEALDRPF